MSFIISKFQKRVPPAGIVSSVATFLPPSQENSDLGRGSNMPRLRDNLDLSGQCQPSHCSRSVKGLKWACDWVLASETQEKVFWGLWKTFSSCRKRAKPCSGGQPLHISLSSRDSISGAAAPISVHKGKVSSNSEDVMWKVRKNWGPLRQH